MDAISKGVAKQTLARKKKYLKNQCFGLKTPYLNSLMQIRIRDLVNSGSESGMEKVGSAILAYPESAHNCTKLPKCFTVFTVYLSNLQNG